MKFLLIILQLNLGLAPVAAFAARGSLDRFARVVTSIRQNCSLQSCRDGFAIRKVYDGRRSKLPPATLKALHRAAYGQAQIWGDTILEGDFQANGDTRLDQVHAVYSRDGRLVAYRIVFSETALSPDGRGRITEAAWINANMSLALPDEAHPATFQVNLR